jgi:histidyl-tRNA synthetase
MSNKKKEIQIPKSIMPALFFGFRYFDNNLGVNTEDIKIIKTLLKEKGYLDNLLFPLEEIFSILKFYKSKDDSMTNPFFFVNTGIPSGNHNKHKKKAGELIINLHFFNVSESITEAIMIQVTNLILKNNGYKNNCLRLNNIGGKTAQTAFNREGATYYRKHISELNPELRQLFKKSLFELYTKGKNECLPIHENAPEPMDFLSEENREHFSELLEFVEYLEIPYEVDSHLLGDQNYSTHTIFDIQDQKTEKTLARGTRYNLISKKLGFKKEIPAISVMIKIQDNKKQIAEKNIHKTFSETKFFLIHVGKMAKIKSLRVLTDLANAGIYTKHSIYRDKLSTQLLLAKKSNAPYHIIIGHREALENSAIVKDFQGRWQKTIKFENLIEYLKTLK